MKKVNIDECYLALISRYGYEPKTNEMVHINSDKVKFTIVKYLGCGEYKDIISDECYEPGAKEHDEIGTLFVNDNYFVLQLNSLIKLDNKFINKKKLLELVREPLIELTSLLHTDERDKIVHIETLQDAFKDIELNNTKGGINTEKLYIASLRQVTYEKNYGNEFSGFRHYKHNHLNFVIVKKCPFKKGKFKDIRFGTVYKNIENCSLYRLGLDKEFILPFNYLTGNKEKKLSYTKVLNKFHETANELTEKYNL